MCLVQPKPMQTNLLKVQSKGFYFPFTITDVEENTSYAAYYKSCFRRLFSPGLRDECIIVSFTENERTIESQYAYSSIYDAMRQVQAYKESESTGVIMMYFYTDKAGLELVRRWRFEYDGYMDFDGEYQIECCAWVKEKI